MVAVVGSQFGIIFSAGWCWLCCGGNLRFWWYYGDSQVTIVAKKRRSPHFGGHFFFLVAKTLVSLNTFRKNFSNALCTPQRLKRDWDSGCFALLRYSSQATLVARCRFEAMLEVPHTWKQPQTHLDFTAQNFPQFLEPLNKREFTIQLSIF